MVAVRFQVADYIIMGTVLLISLGIGVFFGLIRKQRTPEEYLLGNRQMQLLPVAISLIVTFQSAISVISYPAELYMYHTMYLYIFLGTILAHLVQCFMIVPLVYPLRLSSAYEYLGLRYQSRAVQLMGTVLGMLQTLFYMSFVLLAPALSLEAVSGLPLWLSILIVGLIGTFYTSIGGIKSVIWTDVFQFIILYAGLITILILGTMKLRSFKNIWSLAEKGDRIVFDIISADPRVRHTVWGCIVGGFFNWLPNICNQPAIQRMCAMKNMRQSRIAVLLPIPFGIIFILILSLLGLVIYAYFADTRCDPLETGELSSANQVAPYFVMHILTNLPGLAGLFIAVLFCGSLSTLSSGINSMSANTIEDLLVNYLKRARARTQTLIAKISVVVYGCLAIGLAYLVKGFTGPVTQIANSAMGAVGGPVAGMIFLGGLFPQANSIGALVGGLAGIVIDAWVSIGSSLYGNTAPTSPSVGVDGCYDNQTIVNNSTGILHTVAVPSESPLYTHYTTAASSSYTDHLVLYDISYQYFGFIGFFVTMVVGLTVSFITSSNKHKTESQYIFPCLRSVWGRYLRHQKTYLDQQNYKLKPKTQYGDQKTTSSETTLQSSTDLLDQKLTAAKQDNTWE